jgi:hypothetical protein
MMWKNMICRNMMWRQKDVEAEGCGGRRMWRQKDVEAEGCEGRRMWRQKDVEAEGCEVFGSIENRKHAIMKIQRPG